MVMESLSVDSERRQVWTCKMVLHLLLMMVIVLKAMRLHWLKIKVVLKVVRPHWSKIKVQFLGQQRNGIPVVAYIDFSHLKTELSMLPDLQSE